MGQVTYIFLMCWLHIEKVIHTFLSSVKLIGTLNSIAEHLLTLLQVYSKVF